jgi:hypothetical protein
MMMKTKVNNILVLFFKEKDQEEENYLKMIHLFIKDNGNLEWKMDLDFILTKMVKVIQDFSNKIKSMAKEYNKHAMAIKSKENGWMEIYLMELLKLNMVYILDSFIII